VVGLIAATSLVLLVSVVRSGYAAAVFAVALAVLFYSKYKFIVPLVVAGAAVVGIVASSRPTG
jgi:chromate transporter